MDARAALPQNCSKRRLSFASNSENGTSVLPVTHQRAMSALALKRCDENWVSSRQPSDIPAFNRELIGLFSELKQKTREAA